MINCSKANNSFFSRDCRDSYNLYFSKDCANCHDLVACANLRNKSYCIFNQQYSPEEYKKKLAELNLGSFRNILALEKQARDFALRFPVKYLHGTNNKDVTGDDLSNSKRSFNCFSAQNFEDCKNAINGNGAKDCHDCYVATDKSELNYDNIGCANTQRVKFCHLPWSSFDMQYCDACESSNNLFGCVGMEKHQYCVLNKQYTKENYEQLIAKIIEHMKQSGEYGQFFPPDLSPHAYNETINMEYFPLTKEQALEHGYSWQDPDARNYVVTLKTFDIPDHIKDIKDDILDQVIECEHGGTCKHQCTTAFKLIQAELQFYRQWSLPIPRQCHNCRYYGRIALRNPRKLWHRKCMKGGCQNEFETSYAPERPEIVYCEKCYQNEVV